MRHLERLSVLRIDRFWDAFEGKARRIMQSVDVQEKLRYLRAAVAANEEPLM